MDEETVKKIRSFNRYYTVWLEVTNKRYLGTVLSWPQARVIFDVYKNPGISATEVCGHLQMDKSYVSRILANFEKQKLLTREPVPGSKGLKKLWLTESGKKLAAEIDENGTEQIEAKLAPLGEEDLGKLCGAMVFIENTLKKIDRREVIQDEP